jgi:hypothetical protein
MEVVFFTASIVNRIRYITGIEVLYREFEQPLARETEVSGIRFPTHAG